MGTVTFIPAKKQVGKRKDTDAPNLRVAAYCRVSTDTDEQATSYEAQIEHYTDYIKKHPGWELASTRTMASPGPTPKRGTSSTTSLRTA